MVLMDMNMPGMNGHGNVPRHPEAGSRTAARTQLTGSRPVPILILTSYNPGEKLEEFREAGVNDFLYKPFQPEVVWKPCRNGFPFTPDPVPNCREGPVHKLDRPSFLSPAHSVASEYSHSISCPDCFSLSTLGISYSSRRSGQFPGRES